MLGASSICRVAGGVATHTGVRAPFSPPRVFCVGAVSACRPLSPGAFDFPAPPSPSLLLILIRIHFLPLSLLNKRWESIRGHPVLVC